MAAAAVQPLPARVPTPRPKGSRTSSLQPESTSVTASTTTKSSRNGQDPASGLVDGGTSSQQAAGPRRGTRTASADPLSDKATAFLVRRVLCPQQADKGTSSPASIEDLLPPLTSRNDVDLQLYALIAIILREYVQNWYTKITPDETFVAEIVQIIAHITRALEQRLRKVDFESLLFDELPELLDRHVTAYRVAHDPITQPPVTASPREIYHSLCPLPALSPVPRPEDPESVAAQAENEAAYRQLLVYAFLAILLPTEDLENGCLSALVGQIFSELILGNAVANRLSEPWLIWELLIIASRTVGRRRTAKDKDRPRRPSSDSPGGRRLASVHALFWTILQWCFLAASFLRTAVTILVTSNSLPSRASRGASLRKGTTRHEISQEPARGTSSFETDPRPSRKPLLAFRCWSAVSNLAEMDSRMPWLCGALSMLQWITVMGPGRIAGVDGKLDRLLSHGIHRYVLDVGNLPPLLRSVRGALFPNNMPAGKPTLVPPSSEAELRALRRRCASALWSLVPKRVGRLYLGGGGLLRANPVLRASREETEGSAELRTADKRDKHEQHDSDMDKGASASSSSSLSSTTTAATGGREMNVEKAKALETAATPPPGSAQTTHATSRERPSPRSRSAAAAAAATHTDQQQPRSRRSAPAPRPNKTGGQPTPAQDPVPAPSAANVSAGDASAGDRNRDLHNDSLSDDDDEEILREIERGILDVFSDAYCNKHLVYSILELVLVRLLPELADKGLLELWEERLPVVDSLT